MKRYIIVSIILFAFSNGFSQEFDTMDNEKPEELPGWTYFVPGASYFYQGKIGKGSIFSALELSGVYLGLRYNNTLKNNSSSPYYNYPLFLGIKAFETEKLHNISNQLKILKHKAPDFKYDNITEKELYLAPFKPKNVITPITGGMALLAGITLGIDKYTEEHSIAEVDRMQFMDRYINRNKALGVYGATSLAMGWGAGVTEEYVFRNYTMPILDYMFGQKKGVIFSSVLFGAGHFQNLLFAENPNFGRTMLQVTEATVMGYFLGRDVQSRGYEIGPAVAAHAWYDIILMMGSFLIKPEENYLGVNVSFTF